MTLPRWCLVPLLLALAACGEPYTPDPVASLSLSPAHPVVARGDTLRMIAVPLDASGNALTGRAVAWSSSAPDVVSVGPAGLVTAQGRGSATITATSDGRSATVSVTVQPRKPLVTAITISPQQVDVSTADATVDFLVTASADAGMLRVVLELESVRPSETAYRRRSCFSTAAPTAGTSEAGTWKCTVQLHRGAIGGAWRITRVLATDSADNRTSYSGEQLAAAGISATVQVQSADEDLSPPVITAYSVQPDSVSVATGAQTVVFTFTVTDTGTGVWRGFAMLGSPMPGHTWGCGGTPVEGEGVRMTTFRCPVTVPATAEAGERPIMLEALDMTRNLRLYTSEHLKAAGLPYAVTVTR